MMTGFSAGYSAAVKMHLLLNGYSLPVAQMGPDFVILREAVEHGPGDAQVVLNVDGDERRWHVRLPEGLRPEQKKVLLTEIHLL
jgi:hypothetical protein